MLCPKCSTPLQRREHDGLAAFVCGACLGVWMPRGQLERTVRASATRRGAALHVVSLSEGSPRPTSMRCPTCADARLEWLTLRGVRVERCPQCQGVFLEPGEPETITKRVLLAQREWGDAQQEWLRAIEWSRRLEREGPSAD